jgi:hypothetical protein
VQLEDGPKFGIFSVPDVLCVNTRRAAATETQLAALGWSNVFVYFRYLFNFCIETLSRVQVIQGDSGGKANIWGRGNIGHCEENSYELFPHNDQYYLLPKRLIFPPESLRVAYKYR